MLHDRRVDAERRTITVVRAYEEQVRGAYLEDVSIGDSQS